MNYQARDEKLQKPVNVSLEMLNSLAMSPVHQCIKSDMIQLGGGYLSRRCAASGSRSASQASKKFLSRSLDGILSTFSQPSGRPNSVAGKRSLTNWIARPIVSTSVMKPAILEAFTGVVMTLTCAPCSARRRAMSVMGMVWPCAMNGTSTKCGLPRPLLSLATLLPANAMVEVVNLKVVKSNWDRAGSCVLLSRVVSNKDTYSVCLILW
ncbi:hypothetical protein ACP4OV_022213 [Aristida adscensionis]